MRRFRGEDVWEAFSEWEVMVFGGGDILDAVLAWSVRIFWSEDMG